MAEQPSGIRRRSDRGDRGAQLVAQRREGRFVRIFEPCPRRAAITLIVLTWAIELWLRLGFQWFDEQAMVACFGLTLAIVYIRFPLAGGRERPFVPWYDAVLAVLGLGASVYLVWIYGDIENKPVRPAREDVLDQRDPDPADVGGAAPPPRGGASPSCSACSWPTPSSAISPPACSRATSRTAYRLIAELGVTNVALLGLPLKIIVLTVVLFIWMGQLLLHTGASEWFTDLAAALDGSVAGRLGQDRRRRLRPVRLDLGLGGFQRRLDRGDHHPADAPGGLRPQERRRDRGGGFDRRADHAADHGRGRLPDGRAAGARIHRDHPRRPDSLALLYYLAVFVQVDLEAAKNDIAPLPKDRIPPFLRVLKEGWFFALPYAVLVYALFTLNLPAQEAAFWAAISVVIVSLVFGYKRRRITPSAALGFGRRLRPGVGGYHRLSARWPASSSPSSTAPGSARR